LRRTASEIALRLGRRPQRARTHAEGAHVPGRRTVRTHHLPRARHHGRRPADRAAVFVHPRPVGKKGQRAGLRHHALPAGAAKRAGADERRKDRDPGKRRNEGRRPGRGGGAGTGGPRARAGLRHRAAHPRHGRGRQRIGRRARDGCLGEEGRNVTKNPVKIK